MKCNFEGLQMRVLYVCVFEYINSQILFQINYYYIVEENCNKETLISHSSLSKLNFHSTQMNDTVCVR